MGNDASGLLPCGHPPYTEDDKIVTDHCFECGWRTPARFETDTLNALVAERGRKETELIQIIRRGDHQSNETMSGLRSSLIRPIMDEICRLHRRSEKQRIKVKITQGEEDAHGSG